MHLFTVLSGAAGLVLAQAPAPAPPAGGPAAPARVYNPTPLRAPVSCRASELEPSGIVCSADEPCRMFLELTAVEALGPKVLTVGNVHTSTATVSSIALLSDDAGTTWREPTARIPGAGFEAIQFLSEQQIWIAVQPQSQFPHDPYLLASGDGGQTWDAQRLWSEEGRLGVWQQFYFDSRDHGLALVDRSSAGFELYESMNGGASWSLKEVSSRAITPKWPPRRPPEWRLREDARLRTYEVERRAGNAWQRMANFRVEIGICKEPEPPAAADPQPPAENPNP